MPYTSQGKATKEFGITFRSQLEAKWAYALQELKDVKWEYVDSPWHDFVVHAPWGDAKIEVKPIGGDFFLGAAERIPDGETLYVVQGEPMYSEGWTIDTGHPVSCLYRCGANINIATFPSFEIAFLESMFHAARGWPAKIEFPISLGRDEKVITEDGATGPDITVEELVALVETERARQGIETTGPILPPDKVEELLSRCSMTKLRSFQRATRPPPRSFDAFNQGTF